MGSVVELQQRDDGVPPQSRDAEERVISALLMAGSLGADTAATVAGRVAETGLRPEHFYSARLGTVYEAICGTVTDGSGCDVVAVTERLRQTGRLDSVGGPVKLHELAALAASTPNVGVYATTVVGLHEQREWLSLGLQLTTEARDGGVTAETREVVDDLLRGRRTGDKFRRLNLEEMLSGPVPPINWGWNGWLECGDLALVLGDAYVGKSLLSLALVVAMLRGGQFLERDCAQLKCGYADWENSEREIHRRLAKLGVTSDEAAGLCYFKPGATIDTPAGLAMLRRTIEQNSLDVVIVDSFRRAAPSVDENNSAAVASFFAPLLTLRDELGTTIVVLHHSRKAGGDKPQDPGQMARGSGDFIAAVDTMLYLKRREGPGCFTLEAGKLRSALPPDPIIVRIQDRDDRTIQHIVEGLVVDRLTEMKIKVREVLAEHTTLNRTQLALKVGADAKSGTFSRALNEMYEGDEIAKTEQGAGKATLYALIPEAA